MEYDRNYAAFNFEGKYYHVPLYLLRVWEHEKRLTHKQIVERAEHEGYEWKFSDAVGRFTPNLKVPEA